MIESSGFNASCKNNAMDKEVAKYPPVKRFFQEYSSGVHRKFDIDLKIDDICHCNASYAMPLE